MKAFTMVAFFATIYFIAVGLPASSLWLSPGEVRFLNAQQGAAPRLEFVRHIKVSARIKYSVVVRNSAGETACEGNGGPFTYGPVKGPLLGKDLVWWAAGDSRCGNLPIGTYWTETCWTVVTPAAPFLPSLLRPYLGWILPPKHICRISPPFDITTP